MGRRLVCGVDGSENKRAFSSVVLTNKSSDCLEAILTFESEIRQGEHAKAKNLAAILTKRLNKAVLPAWQAVILPSSVLFSARYLECPQFLTPKMGREPDFIGRGEISHVK